MGCNPKGVAFYEVHEIGPVVFGLCRAGIVTRKPALCSGLQEYGLQWTGFGAVAWLVAVLLAVLDGVLILFQCSVLVCEEVVVRLAARSQRERAGVVDE